MQADGQGTQRGPWQRYGRITCGAALLLATGSLLLNVWQLRRHTDYKVHQPRITRTRIGQCQGPGLVAHYRFDELSAAGTPDATGRGHVGQVEYAPAPWARLRYAAPRLVPGKVSSALELSGRHAISAGNTDCFTSEQLTVAAWVWQEDDSIQVPTIAAKSSWPATGWWLCTTSQNTQGRQRYLDFGISWGTGMAHVESGYQLPLREWHHIVATLDNVRHESEFFIDGKPFGAKHTNVHPWLTTWEHDLYIGGFDGGGSWPWKGKLDDVRIYNRILNAQDVAEIYGKAGPGSGAN